ncbi:MAG: hypothetical protein ACKO0Z_09875 [Betaproteobacteria bacterium]
MAPRFPDGKPKHSEILANGKTRHFLKDGRVIELRPTPDYVLSYQSSLHGAQPGDEYRVDISIIGASKNADYFEAWNFKRNELRWYHYDKVLHVTDLETGKVIDGYTLWKELCPDADDDDL